MLRLAQVRVETADSGGPLSRGFLFTLTITTCQANPQFTNLNLKQSGNTHIDTKLDNKKAPVHLSQNTVLFEGKKEGQRCSQNKANFTYVVDGSKYHTFA
jgi:hypothetical protein